MTPLPEPEKHSSDSGSKPSREDTTSSAVSGGTPAPVPIADHQLIRCIGRGSYGQVWLARNMMGVYRAVKIVYRDSFGSQRPFERELSGIRRFEPISRLHEGFMDVLQVGMNEERGYFYYVMELGDDQVSGQAIHPERYVPKTLGRVIAMRGKLPLQECLQLGLTMSQALTELHKHQLVHRDIKPSNIIYINGTPKLADIGLVAAANEAPSYVGTEGFIPPEGPGAIRADIYSLGKVLYEASTGKDRQDFPELPTRWGEPSEYGGLLELNEVILQACKQDPAKRYSSAWELHADLLVIVNGKSVRRLRLLERRMANLKRTGGIAAMTLALLGLVFYQFYRGWSDARESRQRRVSANVTYGNRSMESGDLLGALPYFAEALRLDQGNQDRETTHRLRLGSTLAQCPKLIQMWLASMRVNDGEFSPDGNKVLFAEYYRGKAEVHDLKTGRLYLKRFGPEEGLISAVWSPDGQFIVTASQNHTVIIWNSNTLTELFRLPHPDKVYDARFSPDGSRIITSCLDGVGRIWDVQTRQLKLTLRGHKDLIAFATFSRDGLLIATASNDGTARIWNAISGKQIGKALRHEGWVTCVAFSPDGQMLATACTDHRARVWDLSSGKRVSPELEHNDAVKSVEFSPDGRLILTASFDGTARLWQAESLQPLASNPILRHGERVIHAGFSPDSRMVLTTCNDGSVRIWDLAGSLLLPIPVRRTFSPDASRYLALSDNRLQVFDAASDKVMAPSICPREPLQRADLSYDGRFVLTVSGSQDTNTQTSFMVQTWEAASGRALGPGILMSNGFNGVVLSDDGKKVALWQGPQAQTFDTFTGTALSPPLPHSQSVNLARFNPRGDRLVTAATTNVFVWDSTSGRLTYPALELPVSVGYIDFSRDGRNMVTCSSDWTLAKCFAQMWRVADGHPVGEPLNHDDGVLFAVFSHDGRRIVTTGEDYLAKVWDTRYANEIGLPLRHRDQVWGAAFNSDAKRVATASADKTARVWDPERNDPLTPPLQHPVTLVNVKFLPGDRRLVTFDRDGKSWIWPLAIDNRPADDILMMAQFLSGSSFTPRAGSGRNKQNSLDQIWERLRTKYPANFSTCANEVLAWHKFQAEQSEREAQWFAAVFHWEYVSLLAPADEAVVQRLTSAKETLQAAGGVPPRVSQTPY